MGAVFKEQYKNLNSAQKEAVDTIDGPVMVVAGPGTGKTQILALRIANILEKTDTKAEDILCLTFTNSAVEAMQKRLARYIGKEGEKVNVATFHSFGMEIIKEYYEVLGLKTTPKLLDDADTAILFDEILNEHDWEYLRPRSDSMRYFSPLRSLLSLLKRERIDSKHFLSEVEKEINFLKQDPESISSRGESKGQLKKEIITKIENLARAREVSKFIDAYEEAKKKRNVLDYDDVLENLVKIVEKSKDAASDIREQYLYVLVDEHQDSSRVQNEFLTKLWGKVENPNIFVVGDDRQLIYGFSGASINHFKGFKKTFKDAKLVTLVDNYRSTQVILDASHALLQSVMSDEKLKSQSKEHHPIRLIEANSPADEIVACALDIQDKMKASADINECAILVPKNAQVRSALEILHEMNIPTSSMEALNLFDQREAQEFLRVLKIISNLSDKSALALSFFDGLSGVEPLEAHAYIAGQNMREFSFDSINEKNSATLFGDNNVGKWIGKLSKWRGDAQEKELIELVTKVGEECLHEGAKARLVSCKEIIDTVLLILTKEIEKNSGLTLGQFVSYVERLESFSEHMPIVVTPKEGVKVLTLHSSKGLEFDYVWIAHMDEWSLSGSKRGGFTLPKSIAERIEESDVEAVKRKLYVAITRAKRFCTLSYARNSNKETEQNLAQVIAELPEEVFSRFNLSNRGSRLQTSGKKEKSNLEELKKLVAKKYTDRYVSASLLNNFYECPWKWYFNNLLGLPTPPAETLEFGIAVHSSVDRILKMPNPPSEKEVEKIVLEEISKRNLKDERARERMSKEVEKILHAWVKNRLPEIKLARTTEEGISVKDARYPHLKIFGKIDLIENLGPKEVRVTDFKTGSVRKKSDIEKLDDEGRMGNNLRQLAMYSYMLRENPKWKTDVRESRLEFLEAKNPKESLYDRVIGIKEIDLLIKDITDYDALIKSGEWVGRECHYNSYGKNTECEYCKLAEIYE